MSTFKRTSMTKLAIALALALPLGAPAQNQNPASAGTNAQRSDQSVPDQRRQDAAADSTKPSQSDVKFMKEAAMGGMLEVELGRVAMQNASSEQVKQFGKQMVDDHGKGNEDLKSLADLEGVKLPSQLDPKHARELQRMQQLKGADFDREYMKMMLEDHKKDIKAFNDEGQRGDDPEVKGFALRTLPTLRAHLTIVEHTLASLDANDRRKSDSATQPDPATGRPGKTQN